MTTAWNFEGLKCRHCHDAVIFTGHKAQGFDTNYVHANMIRRCLPSKTGKAYGLEADVREDLDRRLSAIVEPSPTDVSRLIP